MRYHRLSLEEKVSHENSKANNARFDIQLGKQGVAVSLDLWSFRFYTKYIISFLDRKEWVELGIAVAAFKEMIMSIYRMRQSGSPEVQQWSGRLIRVVFYEREIMDLIPQLLSKCHEARKYVSTWYITDIVELAHAVLAIGEQMSEKSMLVRQRRKRKRKSKKAKERAARIAAAKAKRWTKEQIFALEEGVKSMGLHKWDQLTRHPQFGPAMGSSRSADEVMEKWEAIKSIRDAGGEIESDPEIEVEDEGEDGGAGKDNSADKPKSDSDSEPEDDLFDEREFNFKSYLKKFCSNTIVQVYIRLLQVRIFALGLT